VRTLHLRLKFYWTPELVSWPLTWGFPLAGLAGTIAGMLITLTRIGTEPQWTTVLVGLGFSSVVAVVAGLSFSCYWFGVVANVSARSGGHADVTMTARYLNVKDELPAGTDQAKNRRRLVRS